MIFKYVWAPDLDDYFRMGWHLQNVIYERGEHLSFLMVWLCKCDVPLRRNQCARTSTKPSS